MAGKKILFVTHLYAPSVGGAERVFQRLAEGLAAKGHEVTVLTSDALSTEQFYTAADHGLPRRERRDGVRIVRSPIRARAYTVFKLFDKAAKRLGRVGVFFRPLIFGPHFTAAVRERLGKDFDAVIAGPTPTSTIFFGLRLKYAGRTKRLIIFPHMHIRDRLHTTFVNRWALRRADAVLALSDAEKSYLVRRGVRRNRVFRMVNAVDEDILMAPSKRAESPAGYVLYLGQEGEHKRIPLLIKAMGGVWDKGYSSDLVLAGARTYYSATIDRVITALPPRWRERVIRLNDFPESRKVEILDNCRVLVNPSSFEAFGIVFLEAWARRKPVIGARIRAVREIIREGDSGFLFEDRDEADLEAKIVALLGNADLAARMGESGYRDVVARYRWEAVVADLERLVL